MNLSKGDSSKISRKVDKIDDYSKRIDKEIEDIRNILKDASSINQDKQVRKSRRKTPNRVSRSKKERSIDNSDDESDDNIKS